MIHGDLKDYMAKTKPTSDERLILVRDLTQGLTYLHNQDPPVRHGDLKPGNVLVNPQRRALLADFGLSRALDTGPTGLTTGNDARGTVRYSSPEVLLHGTAGQSLSDDIWSWGCLVLEALTDKMPFADIQAEPQLILAIVQGRSPSDVNNLPLHVPRLKDLLVTCWRPQSDQRPTAVNCLRAIEQSLPKLDTDSLAPQRDDIPFQTPQPLGAPEDSNVILERAPPTSFRDLSSAFGITGADNSLGLYTIDPVPGTSRDGSRRDVTGPYFHFNISDADFPDATGSHRATFSSIASTPPDESSSHRIPLHDRRFGHFAARRETEWDQDGQWYKLCQATIVAAAGLGGSQTTLKHDLPPQSAPKLSIDSSVSSASMEPVIQNVNVTHETGSTSTMATKAARSPALRQGKDDPVGATTVTFDPIAKLQERMGYMSGAAWSRELMSIATLPSMGGTGHNKRKIGDATASEQVGRPAPDIKRARGSPAVTKTGATSPTQPTGRSLRKRETSARTQQTVDSPKRVEIGGGRMVCRDFGNQPVEGSSWDSKGAELVLKRNAEIAGDVLREDIDRSTE